MTRPPHVSNPPSRPSDESLHALLADLDAEVLAGASLDDVLAHICLALVERLAFPFCWIGLRTREGGVELRAYHGEGLDGGRDGVLGVDLERGGSAPAVRAVIDGRRRLVEGEGGRMILALPLRHRDEVLGVLTLWAGEAGFDEREPEALQRLADRLTLALVSLRDRERLRLQGAALGAAANAVIITDAGGRIEWVNEAFSRLSGYPFEEVIGRSPRLLESGRVPKAVFADLWRTILSGRSWHGELINRAKDGTHYHVAQTITPILGDDGEASHFVAIHEDISERKLAERQLQEARDAALRASRSKSEFLANISHEIRTPMNGVLGMLGLLADTSLDPMQRDYLDSAQRSGDLLLSLLNNILDYAKIEAGRIELERIPFDPRDIAEDVIALYIAHAAEKRLELGLLIDPGVPPRVIGDPTRLRQILINLVGNAVKFTALGEVAVSLSAVSLKESGVQLFCKVSDSGIGIAPEAQDHIFDIFSQADGSTTRKYGGSGLGLAICRELVSQMDGEIGVDSEPGRGSTFRFTVSLERDREVGEAAPPPLEGLRLVVADEHPLSRDVLENQLALAGVELQLWEGSGDALRALRSTAAAGRPAEVLIISQQLPGNGAETLARAVGEERALGSPRVLLLTPAGNHEVNLNRLAPLCDGLIRKPLRRQELVRRLLALRGREPAEGAGEAAPSRAARILVADDNLTNQRVTRGMLERLGYRVNVVGDGREALALQCRDPHELILMDVQMPELDGFQATAAIRAAEGGARHTPIIALTASTTRGPEQIRRAGMDGFLLKPVLLDQLRGVLEQWLFDRGGGGSIPPHAPRPVRGANGVDLHIFDGIRELMGESLGEVVESFLDDGRERLRRMHGELAADDGEELQRTAHSLKGASANLGLRALSEACAALDENARQRGCEGAAPLLEVVEAAFAQAEIALAELLA